MNKEIFDSIMKRLKPDQDIEVHCIAPIKIDFQNAEYKDSIGQTYKTICHIYDSDFHPDILRIVRNEKSVGDFGDIKEYFIPYKNITYIAIK